MPRFNHLRRATGTGKPSGRIGAGDYNELIDALQAHDAATDGHAGRLGVLEAAVVPATLSPLALSALTFDEDLAVGGVVARINGTMPPGVQITLSSDDDTLTLSGNTLTLAKSVLLDSLLEYVVTLTQSHPAVPQPLVQSFVLACRRPNKVPIVRNEAATATAGTLKTVNVVANDTDPDGGTLYVSEIVSVSGTGCTATINADTVSVDFLAPAGFIGTSNVVYRVSDGELSADGTLSVTVQAAAAPQKVLTFNDAAETLDWVAPVAITGNVTVQHDVTAFPIEKKVTTTASGTGAAANVTYSCNVDGEPRTGTANALLWGDFNLTNTNHVLVDDAGADMTATPAQATGVRFTATAGSSASDAVAADQLPDLTRGFVDEFEIVLDTAPGGSAYIGGFGSFTSNLNRGWLCVIEPARTFRFLAYDPTGASINLSGPALTIGRRYVLGVAWEPIAGSPGNYLPHIYVDGVKFASGTTPRNWVPTLVAGSARYRANGNLAGTTGSTGVRFYRRTFTGYAQSGAGATTISWVALAPNTPHALTETEAEELRCPTTGITSYTVAGNINFSANGGAVNETYRLVVGTTTGGGNGDPAPAGTSLTFNGVSAPLTLVDRLTTRSGVYTIYEAAQADSRLTVEVWVNSLKSDAARLVVWRDPIDKTATGPDIYAPIDLLQFTAAVTHGGVTSNYTATVAHGAARWLENKDLADANPAWLREAMSAAKRDVLPYNRNQGLNGFTRAAYNHPADKLAHVFDPMTLGPRFDGTSGIATSAYNHVGRTDQAGGEYEASRSFLHNVDCAVLDRARASEDSWFTGNNLRAFYNYTRYSLAFPAAIPFGKNCKATVDPQKPQAGESPYEIAYWNSSSGDATKSYMRGENSAGEANWDRDLPHLENTAYVHFLLTEDPLAAMVVNRQTAFALGSAVERTAARGGIGAPDYAIFLLEERGSWNSMSSAFKSWRCGLKIASENGTHVWAAARAKKMLDDAVSHYYSKWTAPAKASTDPTSRDYKARIASAHACRSYNGSYSDRSTPAQTLALGVSTSSFELGVYGGEILYLMTKHGIPLAEELFSIGATYLSNRVRYYQGQLAFQHTSSSGSGYIFGPGSDTPVTASLDTVQEFAAWCAQYNGLTSQSATPFSKDRYAGYSNQVLTTRQFLRLAQAHFGAAYDAALTEFARCEAAGSWTTTDQRFKCMPVAS